MAGDWLKMEANTPEKEEVLAITARMGWDDCDLTVGKLFRIWRWFDQQTTNGNAARVTKALLDRIVGVTGFCDAMHEVGWLEIGDAGITLPKFDRHNGTTAKSRALTAKRVANHKANANGNGDGNAQGVSGALPREEKGREEDTSLRSVSTYSDQDDDKGQDQGKAKGKASGYTPEFEQAWLLYPKRAGGNSKADAFKAWAARLKAGATVEELTEGTERYAGFIRATGRENSEYVKQAATFYGPSAHYAEPWTPPPPPQRAGGRPSINDFDVPTGQYDDIFERKRA